MSTLVPPPGGRFREAICRGDDLANGDIAGRRGEPGDADSCGNLAAGASSGQTRRRGIDRPNCYTPRSPRASATPGAGWPYSLAVTRARAARWRASEGRAGRGELLGDGPIVLLGVSAPSSLIAYPSSRSNAGRAACRARRGDGPRRRPGLVTRFDRDLRLGQESVRSNITNLVAMLGEGIGLWV